MSLAANFWQTKSLAQMNRQEWEAVCDGCAKCCLHKIIDEGDKEDSVKEESATEDILSEVSAGQVDELPVNAPQEDSANQVTPSQTAQLPNTEELHFTNVVCSYLNTKTCACTQYADRDELVPECVTLSQDNLHQLAYMPPSCSYRRLNEGKGLPSWHPLLHKNKKSEMHKAGMSVRGKTVFDKDVDERDFEDHIVIWPLNEID
ncbi:YcgN family cysteine cluster protein [Aliiglaciecola sp. 3_MG-2023]|uniref:YcgN family cysteine cluster protein n=1 Tax=Aliiglaciecola sp. 3_MG-2023 TaxID=3062644 RepID=UPI0026E28CAE|nr:YcgN family cysteine cluster protein [Aliiglaciecola sp. 3_MG-2023]MDO6694684.1 YcgN family cysteine cluster protein [Aliiglaciecola sp. 3_MG-2023]